MMEFRSESEIGQRTAGRVFACGGLAFLVVVIGMGVSHFLFGFPINGKPPKVPPDRDLLIFFPLALLMGGIVSARGFWLLKRLRDDR